MAQFDVTPSTGIQIGDQPGLIGTFTLASGSPATVLLADVILKIKTLTTTITKTGGELTLDSVGIVSFKHVVTERGRHEVRYVWTDVPGEDGAAVQGFFDVDKNNTA